MTLYEELYKIVKGKKTKFWNFAGNHHYQVKLAYVGKYYDEYLTTTHIVRLSKHNFDYIIRKLMYQIIRNTVKNSAQVRFNDYYAKQKLVQVHGSTGDFYGWKNRTKVTN